MPILFSFLANSNFIHLIIVNMQHLTQIALLATREPMRLDSHPRRTTKGDSRICRKPRRPPAVSAARCPPNCPPRLRPQRTRPHRPRSPARCQLLIDSSISSQISSNTGKVSVASMLEGQAQAILSIAREFARSARVRSKKRIGSGNWERSWLS